MKFRRKPLMVEAMKWDGLNISGVAAFTNSEPASTRSKEIIIFGEHGVTFKAPAGSWIIKGIAGDFYALPDELFHRSYDPEPAE